MVKRFFFLLLSIILFVSTNLFANITSELEDLVTGTLTNITESGVYKTQEGGIAVGGSVRVRVPSRSIQIASITPPKFKAGCGGIDLYWGAFSFINSQELTLLLQAISANAVGYAFEMAMEALCPTCNAVLKDLASKINKILGILKNSCYTAKALVNTAIGALTSASQQQCERVGTESLSYPDRVKSQLACITNQGPSMQKVWNEFKTEVNSLVGTIVDIENKADNPDNASNIKYQIPKINVFGNIVMNVLNKLTIPFDDKEIFISVTGTCIFDKPDSDGNVKQYCLPALIDLRTLIYGKSQDNTSVKVYKCDSKDGIDKRQCLSMHAQEENFVPLIDRMHVLLEGIADKVVQENPAAGNLPALTSSEKKFLEICPTPVLSLFEMLKRDKVGIAFMKPIIDISSEYVAIYLANYYINKIILTLRKNQLSLNMPKAQEYIKTIIETAEKNRNVTFTAAMEKFKTLYMNVTFAEVVARQIKNYFSKTKKVNREK